MRNRLCSRGLLRREAPHGALEAPTMDSQLPTPATGRPPDARIAIGWSASSQRFLGSWELRRLRPEDIYYSQ